MICNPLLAVVTASALAGGSVLAVETAANAQQDAETPLAPQRIVIGLDLSKSNPLIADLEFASRVASKVASLVSKLGVFASEVHVRTFGNYDATSNNFAYDAVLSVRQRPANVAADIQRLIAGVSSSAAAVFARRTTPTSSPSSIMFRKASVAAGCPRRWCWRRTELKI